MNTKEGYKWSFFSKITISVLQLIQLLLFSRFLSTQELGFIAIIMVVVNLSLLFMDIGISNAIIQKKSISKNQLSSLYWLNVSSGLVVSLALFFLSPLIADFYNSIEILIPLQILSSTFFIVSFGNQFKLLRRRNLEFSFISKTEIVSAQISFILSLILLFNDYGIYSFIFSFLLNQILLSLFYFVSGVRDSKPKLIFNLSEIRDFISFGLYQMGQNSIIYFNNQLDVLLIGKLLGMESLGVYSVIKQIVMRPSMIINPVVSTVTFPIMSKMQHDLGILKKYYLTNLQFLCTINFFIYIFFILSSKQLLEILLGVEWVGNASIFIILSIYALLRSTTSPAGSLLLSRGRVDIGFWWSIFELAIMTTTIFFSSKYQLIGIVYGLLLFQLFYLLPNWYFIVNKMCNASMVEYFKIQLLPLVICFFSLMPIHFIVSNLISNDFLSLLLIFLFGIIIYFVFNYIFNESMMSKLGFIKK